MERNINNVIAACHVVIKTALACESDASIDQLILFVSACAVKGFKLGDSNSAERFAVAAEMGPVMAALK